MMVNRELTVYGGRLTLRPKIKQGWFRRNRRWVDRSLGGLLGVGLSVSIFTDVWDLLWGWGSYPQRVRIRWISVDAPG